MQTINLDLSVRSVVPLLHAKQGDVGRKFKAVLTDNRTAYPVPPGAAVSVWYGGASGAGNYTDIGAESAVSVSGNEITVELITQMLTNPGAGVVCLVLSTAGGDELGMWNINYCVEPRPGMNSVAAQEYYTAFSQAVANLPYPDASLSIAGKAADAKAVGDALDQKQPKGTYLDVTDKTLLLSGAAADAKAVGDALASHATDKNNPHGVTAEQIGAGVAGKTLWSGSWDSGELTVEELSKYTCFKIGFTGQGTAVLAMKNGAHLRGNGGYSSTAGTITGYYFAATINGENLTFVAAKSMSHEQEGSHGSAKDLTVSSIVGLC